MQCQDNELRVMQWSLAYLVIYNNWVQNIYSYITRTSTIKSILEYVNMLQ